MQITPAQTIYHNNQISHIFKTAIFESAAYQWSQLLFDGYVSQEFIEDANGIIYRIPSNTILQNTRTKLSLLILSELIAIDVSAEARKVPIKVMSFGNVQFGVNPITVDGAPIYTGINPNNPTLIYNNHISKIQINALEIVYAVNMINFQTTSVFTPDLGSTDWKIRSYLTLLAEENGTN